MTSECYITTFIHLVVKHRSKKHIKALWKKQAIIQLPTKHLPTPTHPPTQLSCSSLDLAVMFQPQHSLLPPQHAQAALGYLTFEISLQNNPTKARVDFTHELLTRLSVTHAHTDTERERQTLQDSYPLKHDFLILSSQVSTKALCVKMRMKL